MIVRLPVDPDRRTAIGAVDTTDLIPGFDRMKGRVMKEAYRTAHIDPVTGELVRWRNARKQDCQVCQGFRDPVARDAGVTEDLLGAVDDFESSDLPERQKVALRFVDCYLESPGHVPEQLRADLMRHYRPEEVMELLLRLAGTTQNRVLRALGLDQG